MQTRLDTMPITLRHQDMLGILNRHDQRNESWSLMPSEPPAPSRMTARAQTLELWIDGSPTPTVITLHIDGSWSGTTHHTLGAKLDTETQKC
jgi:hypothetical protein